MSKIDEILIEPGFRETRVAGLSQGRLVDFRVETDQARSVVGNIYLGRVLRVVPHLRAAFVDIGLGKDGFLAAESARHLEGDPRGGDGERKEINQLVHEGQAILVQVNADAVGDKGVRLEADLNLSGSLVVYGPRRGGVSVSRQITSDDERNRLIEAIRGGEGGYVVRTAAEGCDIADLQAEADDLRQQWLAIQDEANSLDAPAAVVAEEDPIVQTVKEAAQSGVSRVVISDNAALARARDFAKLALGDTGPRLDGVNVGHDLFADAGIEDDIDDLLLPKVYLPGGAHIIIEATEALVAIDVDSGEHRGPDKMANALAINLEAVSEIARQVRLRGIAGLVVIDLLKMRAEDDRQKIVKALGQALVADPSTTRIGTMDDFGLLAFTRRRQGKALAGTWMSQCEACDGAGYTLTTQALAADAYRMAEAEARIAEPGTMVVRAEAAVATEMNQGEANVAAFANRISRRVQVESLRDVAADHLEVFVE
jgi:ribonuclease G